MSKIDELRSKIDTLDDELSTLYEKRLALSKEIGEEKIESKSPIDVKDREESILFRVLGNIKDEQKKMYVKQLYDLIFLQSKNYQRSLQTTHSKQIDAFRAILEAPRKDIPLSASIACQGVEGAYSEMASRRLFEVPHITYFKTFDSVINAVNSGLCEYGVLPLENSTAGSVLPVYDALSDKKCFIIRSVQIDVGHCLAVINKNAKIKTIYSHPQALEQCKNYIKSIGATPIATDNTAASARLVKESGDESVAAICNEDCASLYGLEVKEKDIQDNGVNKTTFICISKDLQVTRDANKVSILTTLEHKPGSLSALLNRFYIERLNLTKLVSRPRLLRDDEFMFYFDFEGDVEKNSVINLLSDLENTEEVFTFLGCYKDM